MVHIDDMAKSMEHIINTKEKQIRDLNSDLEVLRKSHLDISRMAEEQVTEKVRSVFWTPKEKGMAFGLS